MDHFGVNEFLTVFGFTIQNTYLIWMEDCVTSLIARSKLEYNYLCLSFALINTVAIYKTNRAVTVMVSQEVQVLSWSPK